MEESVSNKITDYISKGETEKAINLLRDHVAAATPRNESLYHSIVMLLGQFNKFEREQRLGLDPEDKELNRIEYNLLGIVEDLKKGKINIHRDRSDTGNNISSTRESQRTSNNGSPILWIFATLGALLVLLLVIAVMAEEDPEMPDGRNENTDKLEQPVEFKKQIEPAVTVEKPINDINQAQSLRNIDDQVIKNLLANSSWYDTTNGNGVINFDAAGKYATYMNGMGSIRVESIRPDGFIYAIFSHPDLTEGYIAINPQMEGENLNVFVQSPITGAFLPVPMIWTKY